jgi:hypothetical protein
VPLSASGKITQARVEAVVVEALQPARANIDIAATATTENIEDFFICHLSNGFTQRGISPDIARFMSQSYVALDDKH